MGAKNRELARKIRLSPELLCRDGRVVDRHDHHYMSYIERFNRALDRRDSKFLEKVLADPTHETERHIVAAVLGLNLKADTSISPDVLDRWAKEKSIDMER
ncbi:hypothetical protein [Acidithiobacillus thiooxidans]|uniref:hypothetical protein n=1 Tax=Acidithiobacillus thiooxidans TaxID=930 RepID=UPI001C065E36|nr:hypothetical protein [Acidithiobacillus thiooxidans]MBU2844117.1 hypothetical protein [Acidithiobacillus thiooxidans]